MKTLLSASFLYLLPIATVTLYNKHYDLSDIRF